MNELIINNLKIKSNHHDILEISHKKISSGEFILINGMNGQGKSILLKAISGDIIFENNLNISGEILLNNDDLLNLSNHDNVKSKICYIPQEDNMFTEESVIDELYLSFNKRLGINNKKLVKEVLIHNKINIFAPDFFKHLKKNPNHLSGGNKRLLTILSMLLSSKDSILYLIDEPLNNLDFNHARVVSNIINNSIQNKQTKILLMISHCRIFPFLNKILTIKNHTIQNEHIEYKYYNCMGMADMDGFYKIEE